MVVPTDLQVRLERFLALGLPLRACTVSTGVERCQRKCTRARLLADSRTLDFCRRFVPERTLERKSRVRSRARGRRRRRRGGNARRAGRSRRSSRRRLRRGGGRFEPAGPRGAGGGAGAGGASTPPAAGRSGRRRSRYVAPAEERSASTVAAATHFAASRSD